MSAERRRERPRGDGPAVPLAKFSKALVFCPHPDDAEFLAGGTMARWAAEGMEIVLCVVTNGAAGSNDPSMEREELIRTREREQRDAAAVLGISEVIFLGYEDGYVEDSHELRRDMIREIRRHKPEIVVGLDPTTYYFAQRYLNHPDHRRVGEAFLAAVNPGATTVPLYRAELYEQGFEPHQVKACLLGFTTNPDYFVDITDHLETKIAALKAHDSQMRNFKGLEDRVGEMAALTAKESGEGYQYAEGFKVFYLAREEATPGEEV